MCSLVIYTVESFTFLWTRLHDSFGTYKSYYEMLKQLQKLLRWSQNRLKSKPMETGYHQGIEWKYFDLKCTEEEKKAGKILVMILGNLWEKYAKFKI